MAKRYTPNPNNEEAAAALTDTVGLIPPQSVELEEAVLGALMLEKDAVSQEAYEQARTELAMLYADIDIVKSNIALTELHAPFDGVIGLRNVSEGAYASPDVVVAKLTKISPLKIDFFVPERYANQIKPGTRLTFTVEGRDEQFRAEVYATESKVDIETRTFAVRALFPNRQGKQLLPGRFADVKIPLLSGRHRHPDRGDRPRNGRGQGLPLQGRQGAGRDRPHGAAHRLLDPDHRGPQCRRHDHHIGNIAITHRPGRNLTKCRIRR